MASICVMQAVELGFENIKLSRGAENQTFLHTEIV